LDSYKPQLILVYVGEGEGTDGKREEGREGGKRRRGE
jgi:hypothetical protein